MSMVCKPPWLCSYLNLDYVTQWTPGKIEGNKIHTFATWLLLLSKLPLKVLMVALSLAALIYSANLGSMVWFRVPNPSTS